MHEQPLRLDRRRPARRLLHRPAAAGRPAPSPTRVAAELDRQQNQIELIASENIVSRAVLEAQGSVLTNKYAEGYPGRRYYQGCAPSDAVETLAIERAKQLFGCGFANVQPHSGAQANGAVMLALTKPGDTILGMSLDAGGHLTHGAKPAMSGKWFNAVQYGVRRDDHLHRLRRGRGGSRREHRPKLIIAGGSAYPRHIDFARFRAIADEVGRDLHGRHGPFRRPGRGGRAPLPVRPRPCRHHHHPQDAARPARRHGADRRRGDRQEDQLGGLPGPAGRPADARHRRQGGRVRRGAAARVQDLCQAVIANAKALAGRLKERGADLVSGGTDTHLALVDLRPIGVTGKDADEALERAAITCNKNGIPFDPLPPVKTSGIRVGSPAGTTRGFGVAEFRDIADMVADVLEGLRANGEEGNGAVEAAVKARVRELCARFPIYPEQ